MSRKRISKRLSKKVRVNGCNHTIKLILLFDIIYQIIPLIQYYILVTMPRIGNYEIKDDIIGEGCYGSVRKCIDIRNGKEYAIKRIKKVYRSRMESDVLRYVKNNYPPDNILVFHDYFEVYDVDYPEETKPEDTELEEDKYECEEDLLKSGYLVTECIDGSELFDILFNLIEIDCRFSEWDILQIARELFESLEYLHSHNIAHRDVKLENILYDGETTKLIDFGLALWTDKKRCPWEMGSGTSSYKPPESYIEGFVANGDTWKKTDVFAAGMVLYFLAINDFDEECTLGDENDRRSSKYAAINRKQFKFPTGVHMSLVDYPSVKKVIKKCIEPDPKRRPTSSKVLELINKEIDFLS